MRRLALIVIAVSLFAVPTALAEHNASGDGSLVVSNANALTITVQGSGVIFGHIHQGTLTIVEYTPGEAGTPQVSGGSMTKVSAGRVIRWAGADVRFLFPTGRYTLRIEGFGIDISAVGKGYVSATALGTGEDGTISTNRGKGIPLGQSASPLSFGSSKSAGATAGRGAR